MRTSNTAAAVLVGTAFLVGCGQGAAPTSPASVQSSGTSLSSSAASWPAARHQVPFKGELEGTDADSDPTPTSIVVTTNGTGTATELGQFSFSQRVTVSFATSTSTGTAHWVAANGDSLETTIAGSGQPTGTPGEINITEEHTITGGTGRFAGAQGRFSVDRVASAITFTTSGSINGTISSPGASN